MSARASRARTVRSSLAVLLRIGVLFALTVLFLLPYSQGSGHSGGPSQPGTKTVTGSSIVSNYIAKAATAPTAPPF